jgi:predicted nucleic-acid-binding protein
MIAADTNVVVRLIVGDDPAQAERAQMLLAAGIFVPLSVLMETEWVLRGGYRWPRQRIGAALLAFASLEGVTVPATTDWVLARHADGADFADMVHLAVVAGSDGFATFDRRLANAAGAMTPVPVIEL